MRDDSGQASVEWIGLVLLFALALAALVRFAPGEPAEALGPELLHAIGCAVRGGCEAPAGGHPGAVGGAPRGMVSAPPLVPIAPRGRPAPSSRPRAVPAPATRPWGLPGRLIRGGALAGRAGRSAGLLWRRSWILCLGYERARYGFLNPEVRFPQAPIPLSENLRIANDCLSPVDLVRDWDLIRGPR